MSTPAPWKKILVPTDFSDYSLKAVASARKLQQLTQAEVILLHVTPRAFDGLRIHTSDSQNQVRDAARQQLDSLTATHFPGSTSTSVLVKEGHPVEVICEVARTLAADCIFIGTHGVSAVEHYMLGSVTENVVRHAPCTVVVAR